MNGKGDTYRPTDKKKFDEGMDRVFGDKIHIWERKDDNDASYSVKVNGNDMDLTEKNAPQ